MLRYEPGPSKNLELQHDKWRKSVNGKIRFYNIPLEEFDLLNVLLDAGSEEIVKEGISGPSIFIVTEGDIKLRDVNGKEEETLKRGQAIFLKPNTGLKMEAVGGSAEVWGAFVE